MFIHIWTSVVDTVGFLTIVNFIWLVAIGQFVPPVAVIVKYTWPKLMSSKLGVYTVFNIELLLNEPEI